AAQDDDRGRDAALVRAQRSAPREGWQAIRRVTLALPVRARLDPPALTALEADIRFLLRSPWGADGLSALYAEARQNRAFIAAMVQTAPAEDQRRFVNRLRAGLRG
ncbi:MAG: hypothetical protein U1D06_04120, partial [Paracoccaceae bacterium]|nr:hypothetical protein [Paracoccaceae bacterium]